MNLPVVFIHSGNSSYLIHTFYQLKKSNPDHKMYLIGTDESNVYSGIVTHVPMSSYMKEANHFKQLYRHFSTNSEAFELICLQRWFILKEFLREHNIDRCLYLDSDVLFYSDINALETVYEQAGMTICGISGHTNFIQRDVLELFCASILQRYDGPDAIHSLQQYYETDAVQKGAFGCISDMTFLTDFALLHPEKVVNIYTPESNATFDPSFNVGEEYFVMKHSFKKIEFQKNMPYGTLKNGQTVLFHTLHFQGSDAKKMMCSYIPLQTLQFLWQRIVYKAIYIFQKAMLRTHL
ncbi:MAG: hypothetical protein H7259_07415 [Cytophagales bacterium]|nr:hypothetical protein [Cytophaga sp.]